MIVTGNLIMVILSYAQAIPYFAVGGSRLIFYGDCQGTTELQIQLTAALMSLTCPYVPPFRSRKGNHQTIPTLF